MREKLNKRENTRKKIKGDRNLEFSLEHQSIKMTITYRSFAVPENLGLGPKIFDDI